MRRILAGLLFGMLALPALAQPKVVSIANFGEHTALLAAVKGSRA